MIQHKHRILYRTQRYISGLSIKQGNWREHGYVPNKQLIMKFTGNNAVLWVGIYTGQNPKIIQLKS